MPLLIPIHPPTHTLTTTHPLHTAAAPCRWVSVSNDLRKDAERDLRDIGAPHIKCFPRVGCSWAWGGVSVGVAVLKSCMQTTPALPLAASMSRTVAPPA